MEPDAEILSLDTLEGSDYERAIVALLEARGYVDVTPPDETSFGADLLARKNDLTFAVRVKRSIGHIDHQTVQEVLGGAAYTGADRAIVIANASFSRSAKELAERAAVELIDRETLKRWVHEAGGPAPSPSITPRPHQLDALRRLRVLRGDGEQKALVVMASGLGKTYVSAFDAAQFEAEAGEPIRVLYLTHQSVILAQASATFGRVFGTDRTYGRFDGEIRETGAEFTFATFQSAYLELDGFDSGEFDYVIVDEAHHTAARTRDAVVRHFQPRFMLGLTATDFRGDGKDIYAYYDDVVAASVPLERALMDGLLTPIDFRGYSDPIDRDALADAIEARSRSRRVFQPQDDERTVQAMLQALDHEFNGERRTLVFCASLAQMDRYQQLIPGSRTVSGRESRDEQVATVEAFNEGEFDVLLSRDVLNEGIDVPHANALIFLRNTESPVVFLQQLGRGLRRIEGKDRVLVLDFINNLERVEFVYSFFSRIRAAAARNGAFRAPVPPARFEFDQTARDIVRALIQKKLESGILVDLHGMSGALDFEVSAETLRHIARGGRLTPDYVEPRSGRPDAFYFTHASVRKFMRQVHAPRIPEGLLSLHEFADLVGQNEAAIRKLQRVGDLPASWIERRGHHLELYFSEADVIRQRTPPSLAQEAAVLADDADDQAEKEEILSLLDDLAPRAVIE